MTSSPALEEIDNVSVDTGSSLCQTQAGYNCQKPEMSLRKT
jgi:hypothetical protein